MFQVDCFSFGMFLYELITLKHPFEGQEHVKERLLEGARPVFLPHVGFQFHRAITSGLLRSILIRAPLRLGTAGSFTHAGFGNSLLGYVA